MLHYANNLYLIINQRVNTMGIAWQRIEIEKNTEMKTILHIYIPIGSQQNLVGVDFLNRMHVTMCIIHNCLPYLLYLVCLRIVHLLRISRQFLELCAECTMCTVQYLYNFSILGTCTCTCTYLPTYLSIYYLHMYVCI